MELSAFLRYFDAVEDPRIERAKKHLLSDIIVIAVLSFISGAEGWEDIEDFGQTNHDWLKQYLSLPNGIPGHDTFARVFALLNPAVFQQCFIELTRAWIEGRWWRVHCD